MLMSMGTESPRFIFLRQSIHSSRKDFTITTDLRSTPPPSHTRMSPYSSSNLRRVTFDMGMEYQDFLVKANCLIIFLEKNISESRIN
mmetsp:Transcript_8617/g.13969  ORF Transcript_8617/g.13969 Transcript_8617/m.13969 type:complete len:87 (+) Transcript_8617:819-1079(+)